MSAQGSEGNGAFRPNLMSTGIGSLPLTDPDEAARFVLDAGFSIPFWPQLPPRSFLEGMIPQYSEGMPCVHADPDAERISFDARRKYERLEPFYEALLAGDPEAFAISEPYAAGLFAFLRRAEGRTWPMVKGQVTGPITFTTGIADENKTPLYNDAELRDAAVKLLARKARWQVRRLQPLSTGGVLIFVDEPVLAAYGSSAYVGIGEQNVHEMEGELFEAIAEAGAVPAMHVCGNSDWGVVMRTAVQVLNFDAYQYGTTLGLYPDELAGLLDRGGCVAWGLVPTSEAIRGENVDSLARRFDQCVASLTEKGFAEDLVRERSALTPSCGAGSMEPDDARRVFQLLRQLRDKLAA